MPSVAGRLIVTVTDPSEAGLQVGQPLADQEDRVHLHSYSTKVTIPDKQIAAIGCCNDQGACHGDYPAVGNFESSASGYPFCQLVFCTINQPTQDPVPFGTIGYFDTNIVSCPVNWMPFQEGVGRFLLPGYYADGVLPSVAPPLKSGEDRLHSHTYLTNITTVDVSYVGAESCCDDGPSATGEYPVTGESSSASSGLPYVQLLTCVSQNATFDSKFPAETLLFNEVSCPPGWNVSLEAAGRLLVALPNGGEPGATFGGHSFPPKFTGNPQHTHWYSGTVTTQYCGVGLASGCCGSGYAGNGVYPYKDASYQQGIDLPFLNVPLCVQ